MALINALIFLILEGILLLYQSKGTFCFNRTAPQAPNPRGCSIPNAPEINYHAPQRFVPFTAVNSNLKRQFLLLFHRGGNHDLAQFTSSGQPEQNETASLIDPAIINEINKLCGRDSFFYSFSPHHKEAFRLLQQDFTEQRTAADLLYLASWVLNRNEINPKVWYYALLATFLSRPDLNGYILPGPIDATPDYYVPWTIIQQAIGQSMNSSGNGGQDNIPECIDFNGTNGTSREENLLWYLREDVQVNEHHWFWHQYHPSPSREGREASQMQPDRRGEVFYFMHHHLIARYNAERYSNDLPPVTPIDLRLNGNIGPGYFPDLKDSQSGMSWKWRFDNTRLRDISHENDPNFELDMPIDNLTAIYRTMLNHTMEGVLFINYTTAPGQAPVQLPVYIRNGPGIDHLGNTLEAAADLSLNTELYNRRGIHNFGHIVISLATDPDYRSKDPPGVMADASVSMRDPSFYRWHGFVDEFFDVHKLTLNPYQLEGGEWQLRWPGVNLRSVDTVQSEQLNNLQTFWSIRRFPLEQGIDGSIHDGDVNSLVCQKHLNHEPFQFRFIVDVDSCAQMQSNRGTIRLFMAPRFDLNGRRFTMAETRKLMFQLDAFPVLLRRGRNVITRNSQDSSSTRPWSRTLQELLQDPDNGRRTDFCGCGWPQHLYIPKGRPEGMEFDLFAMITNWDEDRVEDTQEDLRIPEPCRSPYLYCGVPYRRYPDRRPMGYPFDRQVYSVVDQQGISRQVESLEEWVANVGNAMGNVVTIRHLNRVSPAPHQQP